MRRVEFFGFGLLAFMGIIVACTSSTSDPAPINNPDGSAPQDGQAPVQDSSTPSDDGAAPDANAPDATDASDGAAVCQLPGVFGSEVCHACLREKCCGVITACDQDTACKPLLQCVLACLPQPDVGECIETCKTNHAAGVDKYNEVDTCYASDPPEGCLDKCS